MKNLVQEFVQLKGEIPEHIRALVARRVARALFKSSGQRDVAYAFVKACELDAGDPVAPPRVPVERDSLAQFVDRWLHAVSVRDGDEWRPINPDENCIRVTMCAELLELAGIDPKTIGIRR